MAQGGEAAAISLHNTEGQRQTIEHFSGRVSIIHFWATWCSSCLTELPQLTRFAKAMEPQGLSVMYIAADSHDATRRYLQAQQLELNVLVDQYGKTLRDYGIQVLPTSIVIDSQGRIVDTFQGKIDWESAVIQDRIARWLSRQVLDH